jgi:RNA polymerase primary sigma factor
LRGADWVARSMTLGRVPFCPARPLRGSRFFVGVSFTTNLRSPSGVSMFFSSKALDSFDQYLQDVEKYPLIEDAETERQIARRARAGDRAAAERLVTANLRFVISYVKKYQGRGLNLAELVCIGNEGLLKAVKKFDPDKGVKFISYAVWWIRQTVLQALAEQTRSVRIPLNQNSNLVKLSRTETALTQQLGRTPTDREIADRMGEPVQTIRALRRVASAELSLDAPLDRTDRDSASFGERFSGLEDEDIQDGVEFQARRQFLQNMFEKYLTERERKILVLYYGLDDGEEMTLEEIGSLLGVTRERIRQIRNRAFEKLRQSPDGQALEGFWAPS